MCKTLQTNTYKDMKIYYLSCLYILYIMLYTAHCWVLPEVVILPFCVEICIIITVYINGIL